MEWLFVVIPILLMVLVAGAIMRALILDFLERGEGDVSLPGGLEVKGPSMGAGKKAEQRSRVKAIVVAMNH